MNDLRTFNELNNKVGKQQNCVEKDLFIHKHRLNFITCSVRIDSLQKYLKKDQNKN